MNSMSNELLDEVLELIENKKVQRAMALCRIEKIKKLSGYSVNSLDRTQFELLLKLEKAYREIEELKSKQSSQPKKSRTVKKTKTVEKQSEQPEESIESVDVGDDE